MARSLRSRLILASLLWTAGLLMLMHMASMVLVHALPALRGANAAVITVIALILMASGFAAARSSLTPLRSLRTTLLAIQNGESSRVNGDFPGEMQPIIADLNSLLAHREQTVQRALAAAADLAHGLKTPLALLARDPDPVNIAQQVTRMSRQVDYHLARARAAASSNAGAAPCPVSECVSALIRTLSKLYAGRVIEISSGVGADLQVRVHPQDLDEMLGNVMDNACKWAKSRVTAGATLSGTQVAIDVDDDGPGLAPELRRKALERGVRLDQTAPGSGLGLAIVRDLAELYGGTVALDESPLGGLRVRIWLPT